MIVSGNNHAGGYYVPEVGGRAAAMGTAVDADGDDPSAVFHDPANLVRTEGFQAEVAVDLVLPQVTFFRRPLADPNTGQNLHFDGASNNATPFMQDLIHANAAGNVELTAVDNVGADRLYRDCTP